MSRRLGAASPKCSRAVTSGSESSDAGRAFVESERNWSNSAGGYREVYARLLPNERQRLLGLAGAV